MPVNYAPAPMPEALLRWYRTEGHQSDLVIPGLLRRNASEFGRLSAVIDQDVELSWRELVDAATRFSGFLQASGVQPGDVVTWQIPNWWEALVVAYGVWFAGAVNNPIVELAREHEVRQVIEAVRPRAIVTVKEFRGFDHGAMWQQVCRDSGVRPVALVTVRGAQTDATTLEDALRAAPGDARDVDPDDPAVIVMTSGTTSGAKGVVHSTRGYLSYPLRTCRWYSLGWSDRAFSPFTMGHVGGLTFGLAVPLFTGGSTVLADRWDAELAVRSIRAHGVTYSGGTALFAQEIVDVLERDGTRSLPMAKGFLCGASPFSVALANAVEELGLKATRAYGMTEVPTVSGSAAFDPLEIRVRTDGYVAPGCEIRVVDENGGDVRPGEVGEFLVRGPHRALGYLSEEHTRLGFDDDGWFRSGDLGTMSGEGIVNVTGRLKDVINRGGEKFSSRDIEEAIGSHPSVFEAAVVPAPHPRYGEQPAAFVVLRPGASVGESELVAFLRGSGLASQKVPEVWRFAPELPRTAAGKVKKFLLVEALTDGPAHGPTTAAP